MLGKLFNLTAGGAPGTPSGPLPPAPKPVSSLESVQEDIHTRNLLFPDTQALYQHRHDQVFPLSNISPVPGTASAGAFDYDGDIDLDVRDVRVLIMQDALGSMASSLLYDSQAPPPMPATAPDRPSTTAGLLQFHFPDGRRVPTSPRKSSIGHSTRPLVIQPDSPQLRQGAFDRRPSVQGRSQPRVETEAQRAYREYSEELAVYSSCIFGNSELLAYKGTSTKVHVVPSDPRAEFSSLANEGRGSFGRSSLRSSKLSQSFSSENVSPFAPPAAASSLPRAADRKKVLITRLFPVTLPGDDDASNPVVSPHSRFSEDNTGYPFPQYGEDSKVKKKKPQVKQKRTPMYAVALIINLPQGPTSAKASGRGGAGSYTEQDSFPSSYGSGRRSGWAMIGTGLGIDSLDTAYTNDIEERIDPITQHWDIIMRSLTHLQSVAATTVFAMLKHADLTSPDPFSSSSVSSHVSRTPSVSGRRSEDGSSMKPPKSNAKLITLLPNCLLDNGRIKAEVDSSRARIVSGLRASRVITGQNRWGIWRDEARWVAKWASGKEQGDFFFNLLTGFLATHTDWLQALSPPWYRKRHLQQKNKVEEDMSLPGRTIVVAHDRIAARRLIFLLSAFLPASQPLPTAGGHRPSTSASWAAFSQSPPSYIVPVLKEESLRRKINRRTGPRRASHSRNVSLQGGYNSPRSSAVPPHLAHLSMERGHERRPSDTPSIKAGTLPIPGNDANTRKSSAATTTTITPEATIPHFTTVQRADSPLHARPGSAASVAADDLKRNLVRGDSTGQYSTGSNESQQSSRWGSVISGLWSHRRRDSTNTTARTRDSVGSRDAAPLSPSKPGRRRSDALARMVKEVQARESPPQDRTADMSSAVEMAEPETPRLVTGGSPDLRTQALGLEGFPRTPDPAGAFESPVKTSINADDGVIDVDVPFPEYITSFETAVSSPSSSGYLSTPGFSGGLEAFEQACRVMVDGDVPTNVAGWLQRYHPDFILQAIPPQADVLEQVKASLRAEPSPAASAGAEPQRERWLDISSVVIADTTNHTITRLRYRRLVRPRPALDRAGAPLLAGGAVDPVSSALVTPAISPYETQLEDEFSEETIEAADDFLMEAVERVLALTSDISKGSSNCSSRSASVRRDRSNSASLESDEAPIARLPRPPHEVPRNECKTVVLSALEEIAREVANEKENERPEEHHQDRHHHDHHPCGHDRDNVLRSAIRAWFENVDSGE